MQIEIRNPRQAYVKTRTSFAMKFGFGRNALINYFMTFVSETVSSDLVNVVSQPESIHEEEEEIVTEQKDDKLGFCEIQ